MEIKHIDIIRTMIHIKYLVIEIPKKKLNVKLNKINLIIAYIFSDNITAGDTIKYGISKIVYVIITYNIMVIRYMVYIQMCIQIEVDGGLDDLERVISTKDSLQNHLSLAMYINHASAQSSSRRRARDGYFEGVYITVAVAVRVFII